VLILKRPVLVGVDREFLTADALLRTLESTQLQRPGFL